jgi:hypothetical protein
MEIILKLLGENPKMLVPIVKEYIEAYKPIVYGLVQELVEIYKDYSNNTEYPATVAKVKKNMYDAYINVGFTEDQALALMINDNIQLMKSIKQTTGSVKVNNK